MGNWCSDEIELLRWNIAGQMGYRWSDGILLFRWDIAAQKEKRWSDEISLFRWEIAGQMRYRWSQKPQYADEIGHCMPHIARLLNVKNTMLD